LPRASSPRHGQEQTFENESDRSWLPSGYGLATTAFFSARPKTIIALVPELLLASVRDPAQRVGNPGLAPFELMA
jgi:hypothetical protein